MAVSKPAGTWTYEDLFTLPDDGKRYEIIEGELYEMPSPTSAHAAVIVNLITLLIPIVANLGGRWFTAPLDVFFHGADPVQPDILVLLPDGAARIERRGIEGVPDLVIEVISPSHRGRDLLLKRALYARAGVREYWIVDPTSRTVEMLTLDGDALRAAQTASGDDEVRSLVLDATLPVAAIFAGLDEIED